MNDLYIVLTVSLITWAGIFFYLLKLETKIKRLEKYHEEQ